MTYLCCPCDSLIRADEGNLSNDIKLTYRMQESVSVILDHSQREGEMSPVS
jgi:hypothetical protein